MRKVIRTIVTNLLRPLIIASAFSVAIILIFDLKQVFISEATLRDSVIPLFIISISFLSERVNNPRPIGVLQQASRTFITTTFICSLVNIALIDLGTIKSSLISIESTYVILATTFILLFLNRKSTETAPNNENSRSKVSGKKHYAILLVILLISVLLKYDFWNTTFTGEHSQKYNGYVEPTLMMEKTHVYYPNNKLFESNPLISFYGSYDSIGGNIPLTEWSVFLANHFLPKNLSIEYKTRFAMNAIGLILLLLSFRLYKKIFDTEEALVFTALLAIQPLYQLLSFLTVADGVMFIFLIQSLIKFFDYNTSGDKNDLYLCMLLGGVSALCKDSSLIMTAPIGLYSVIKLKNIKDIVSYGILSVILLVSPKIVYFLTLYNLPKGIALYTVASMLGVFAYWVLYKLYPKIINGAYKLSKKIYFAIGLILFLCLLALLRFQYYRIEQFTTGFVISPELISSSFFAYLLKNKILTIMSTVSALFAVVSFIVGQTKKSFRLPFNIILVSSIAFLIGASKVIYFHTYYRFYFSYAACFFTAAAIVYALKNVNLKHRIFLLSLFVFVFATASAPITNELLSKQKIGINEASQYIEQNLSDEEFFMYNREAHIISIYSMKHSFDFRILNQETFKKNIEEYGVKSTLDKYKVKYYITTNPDPKFAELIAIFSKEFPPETQESQRGSIILKEIYNESSIYKDLDKRIEEIQRLDLGAHLLLEKQFGDYYIYKII